jgi:hypothetical protein
LLASNLFIPFVNQYRKIFSVEAAGTRVCTHGLITNPNFPLTKMVTLKNKTLFENSPVDFCQITSVKTDVNKVHQPSLWVLYFFKKVKASKQLVQMWFFESEEEWTSELAEIKALYPHVSID